MRASIAALCLCSATAYAQSARPAVGPVRPFTPPAVQTQSVNGLRIALVPYGTVPTARVELVIGTGRAHEDAAETGISQLVGDYLLEGTTARSGQDIARELAELGTVGGALSVTVGTHETLIAGEALAEAAPRLVALIGEIALSPAFDSAALERLRGNVRRRNQATAPASVATVKLNELLFPGDAADRIPSDETLRRVNITALRRFHARAYVASRARLYVAGVFDANAVMSAARRAFEPMKSGDPGVSLAATRPLDLISDTTPVVHLIDRPNATQTRIHIAFPVVDPSHPDHLVLNQLNLLMGSVQTSRIIANVRERHGYSYNISSRLARRPGGTNWSITGDVNRDVTGAALREILGEIDRVKREPPTGDELSAFQRFSTGGVVAEMSTARGILEYLRFFDLYGIDAARYLANQIPSIQGVTPTDISRVVAEYLRPQRRVIVLVGDAAAIEKQLVPWTRVIRAD